jgi:hypothetical protein
VSCTLIFLDSGQNIRKACKRTEFSTKILFYSLNFQSTVSAYFSSHTVCKIELICKKNLKIAKVAGPQKSSANLQTYFFLIADLPKCKIFRIYDLQINHYKFSNFRFANCHTSEICRFAIAELTQEFVDLRFADSQKNVRVHF